MNRRGRKPVWFVDPRQDEIERFSHQNPPANIQVAQQTIQSLRVVIKQIENQLARFEVGGFRSRIEFILWHEKAQAALEYNCKELKFLESWVSHEETRSLRSRSPIRPQILVYRASPTHTMRRASR